MGPGLAAEHARPPLTGRTPVPRPTTGQVLGLLLAAGSGRRMGRPKALLYDARGQSFLRRAVGGLREGGCGTVVVVLGAGGDRAVEILGDLDVDVVHASDWAEGMGASLRAGLAHALSSDAACALVTLVDLPDVGGEVTRRLLDRLPHDPSALGRATYAGAPGHPVLLGRDHWAGAIAAARGDRGARDYLARHSPTVVECGDLAAGTDVDTPDQLG